MALIPIPDKIEYKDKKNNVWKVEIAPCYPGYGVTIGNALRRVLLSSLPGAAITAVKIDGIMHEFDSMEYVKEDVVDIILNLKQLKLKVHSEEPVKLELKAKGEKKVTAGDITKNAAVEIANKDLVIATLTDKKAELTMELTARNGRGYVPVDDSAKNKEAQEIGNILIDAIFSPILNVGFEIEYVRVGQQTDYEKIKMEITTDGTMTAQEAVNYAVDILCEQFQAVKGKRAAAEEKAADTESSKSKK